MQKYRDALCRNKKKGDRKFICFFHDFVFWKREKEKSAKIFGVCDSVVRSEEFVKDRFSLGDDSFLFGRSFSPFVPPIFLLSIRTSVHQHLRPIIFSLHPFIHPHFSLSGFLFSRISVLLSFSPPILHFFHSSVPLSFCLSVNLSLCPFSHSVLLPSLHLHVLSAMCSFKIPSSLSALSAPSIRLCAHILAPKLEEKSRRLSHFWRVVTRTLARTLARAQTRTRAVADTAGRAQWYPRRVARTGRKMDGEKKNGAWETENGEEECVRVYIYNYIA